MRVETLSIIIGIYPIENIYSRQFQPGWGVVDGKEFQKEFLMVQEKSGTLSSEFMYKFYRNNEY